MVTLLSRTDSDPGARPAPAQSGTAGLLPRAGKHSRASQSKSERVRFIQVEEGARMPCCEKAKVHV